MTLITVPCVIEGKLGYGVNNTVCFCGIKFSRNLFSYWKVIVVCTKERL